MIETWIDELTKTWGAISAAAPFGGGQVLSYNLVTDANFPESIDPQELKKQPIAITFVPSLSTIYSRGGPRIAYWTGETEFHLAPDMARERIGGLLPWYRHIWNAAAGNPTLNSTVELFRLPQEEEAMSELIGLRYGNEAPHWGLVVKWHVKEHVHNEITVGGPP